MSGQSGYHNLYTTQCPSETRRSFQPVQMVTVLTLSGEKVEESEQYDLSKHVLIRTLKRVNDS